MEFKLRYYGDPILRIVCDPVETFDELLEEEARVMVETMYRERVIGLAGPQVGLTKRLLVAVEMKHMDDHDAPAVALVNPEIIERSKETWEYDEGCLSIPGITAPVIRSEGIVVRFQDLKGEEHTITANGMFARELLHEIDHLNGRMFVDYLSAANKSLIKPELKKIVSDYSM